MLKKNKALIISLAGLLIVTVVALIGYRYLNQKNDPEVREYKEITMYSIDKKTRYGSVWVDQQKINTDISLGLVNNYVHIKANEWEHSSLEYPIGGMLPNGTLWDGIGTTDITKKDFLIPVYIKLDTMFGDSYYFDLVEK